MTAKLLSSQIFFNYQDCHVNFRFLLFLPTEKAYDLQPWICICTKAIHQEVKRRSKSWLRRALEYT
uniref:Uncharacterized protein n=1 Tax=Lepeophtheirus salmonis TaxID=72036 RepID=A0A0K2VAL2_LEPSM